MTGPSDSTPGAVPAAGARTGVRGLFLAVSAVICACVACGTAAAMPFPKASTFHVRTGVQQVYVVPAGVAVVNVLAVGAAGSGPAGLAGMGLQLQAAFPVRPRQTLYTIVGDTSSFYPTGGAPGGTIEGQTGGGASVVQTCSLPFTAAPNDCGGATPEPRVIVAGGGGGAGVVGVGSACGVSPIAGSAGPGSTLVTTAAGIVIPGSPGGGTAPSTPAGGGSITGGLGGVAGDCSEGAVMYGLARPGIAGGAGAGGLGGDFGAGMLDTAVPPEYGGGGGGAGYEGGGGGASGQQPSQCEDTNQPPYCIASVGSGGGGGGSSFVSRLATLLPGTAATTRRLPEIRYTPEIAITRPTNGAVYTQGTPLTSHWACRHPDCTGPRRIDTAKIGQHTFTVTWTISGRRIKGTVAYTVVRKRTDKR